MGCYPSSEKISSEIIKNFRKLWPDERFTDIDIVNEKRRRLENLESLFRNRFDNPDWTDEEFLIEDYIMLDKIRYCSYVWDSYRTTLVNKSIIREHDNAYDIIKEMITNNGEFVIPIPVKYENGIQQLISDDEINILIDKIVKVPHTRKIKVSKYKDCIWKYKVHIQRIKNV